MASKTKSNHLNDKIKTNSRDKEVSPAIPVCFLRVRSQVLYLWELKASYQAMMMTRHSVMMIPNMQEILVPRVMLIQSLLSSTVSSIP